ncbi:L,D-transpeptidase family protein [Sabulicella glaciei]|uniref:L,D-transpeptidase family protein n=1 Tax=Sabulicella glaciei TaxID=2984948 RepID=A0ABT3NRA2_9PROT|nr:L,D-transpeptidase family protein [Roseococcus sp. MDT2-1-1]MCW8084693.1 L,D-transpeptidase family protein [Roseococcus sp. MDT2-1-1]
MDRRHFLAAVAALGAASGHARAQTRAIAASPEALARLAERLLRVEEDGLDPRWYDLGPATLSDPAAILRAAGMVMTDLLHGRAGVPAGRVDLRRDTAAHPLGPWLAQITQSAEPVEALDRAAQAGPEVAALKAGLAAARARALRPLPAVPSAGGTLEPGALDAARVPALRARLAATDPQLAAHPGTGEEFNEALVAAVRRFQSDAGLEADGRVGALTFAALNRSPQHQVDQIRVALDMRRGLAPALRERRIEVNVPDYRLLVLEEERVLMDMAVVVGRPARATPMIVTRLTAVQFNPPWGVPQRLAKEDMLPRLRRDPQSLAQRGIRIFRWIEGELTEIDPMTVDWRSVHPDRFPFILRQDAGDLNALGRLKFIMPNGDDIFLHDTPERQYFRRPDRAFSSGCIRLERPMDFLTLLLDGMPGWDRERADRMLASRATSVASLRRQLPIRLHYSTVTVAGRDVRIRPDIYGLDQAYARAMESRAPRVPVAARS